jgi:predicted DNA-binding antitoxin AbrB/MazE fold protein
MSGMIAAIYEQGVLRPLAPLALPEHTQVQLQIVEPDSGIETERRRVRQVLIEAGVIQPRAVLEPVQPIAEITLTAAAQALAKAGPLSELIIAEREGR